MSENAAAGNFSQCWNTKNIVNISNYMVDVVDDEEENSKTNSGAKAMEVEFWFSLFNDSSV